MNYYISTYNNGQPFILYLEGEQVYLYVIKSGKIHPKGIIITNVKSNFRLHICDDNTKQYISYISKSNSILVFELVGNIFQQILSIPIQSNNIKIIDLLTIPFANSLISVTVHTNTNDTCDLCVTTSNTTIPKKLLENISNYNYINYIRHEKEIILIIKCEKIFLWSLSEDLIIRPSSIFDYSSITKIQSLKKIISEKDLEIQKLIETQEHIKLQYNDLAEYATTLQDELRKTRLTPF